MGATKYTSSIVFLIIFIKSFSIFFSLITNPFLQKIIYRIFVLRNVLKDHNNFGQTRSRSVGNIVTVQHLKDCFASVRPAEDQNKSFMAAKSNVKWSVCCTQYQRLEVFEYCVVRKNFASVVMISCVVVE
jgi:hypothetical protein